MLEIELQTGTGEFVAVVEILPFQNLPGVVVWGTRAFQIANQHSQGREVYTEAFATMSLTPSPGKPR